MVAMLSMRPGSDSRVPVVAILALPFLVEGVIAFAIGVALRQSLKDRLTFSPIAVALASCAGLFAATLLVGTLALAWQRVAPGRLDPRRFLPIVAGVGACGLAVGSALGVWAGCRYTDPAAPSGEARVG
jgi:hypothetical protein